MVVYPASERLQTDRSEFSINSGKMSISRVLSLSLCFGSSAFVVVCAICSFDMPTRFFDGSFVAMCGSVVLQKLDMVDESKMAVAFGSLLFLIFRSYFLATLLFETLVVLVWLRY